MTIAYGIYSGGLDSMLAARLLLDQGIGVRLLTFETPFFDATKAMSTSRAIGLTVRPVDITGPHLAMMAAPKHGFGRFANPCIDCHALMFNQAGRIMEAEGGDFLFSGEVLGQRPKSQNIRALGSVAKDSGYGDKILRPLSALHLPPTPMEETGLVDRARLLGLSGRSRKPQMALAAGYGITDFPTPAGGCLLTDPIFAQRLKELMAAEGLGEEDARLLKWGRHMRLPGGAKLVVGRNKADNAALERAAEQTSRYALLGVAEAPGPTALLSLESTPADLELAASITLSYAGAKAGETALVSVRSVGGETLVLARRRPKHEFMSLLVG